MKGIPPNRGSDRARESLPPESEASARPGDPVPNGDHPAADDSARDADRSLEQAESGSEPAGLEYDGTEPWDQQQKNSEEADDPQLSAGEGVGKDMGTIALEQVAGRERAAVQSGLPLAAALPAELAGMTDAEIMQRAGAGDDACFEYLILKYRRAIVAFMYRTVHNQAVAEELAQEVFLRVYRARATYRADARFTTWLYRIAANMAINHARDTKHERASSSVYLDQPDEESGARPDVADLRPIAEQDLLRDEKMHRIREQVMSLPERQRLAVVMHKYQDMDYRQIGAVLKLSESATKSLLFRAYQTLRERLKEFA